MDQSITVLAQGIASNGTLYNCSYDLCEKIICFGISIGAKANFENEKNVFLTHNDFSYYTVLSIVIYLHRMHCSYFTQENTDNSIITICPVSSLCGSELEAKPVTVHCTV